MIQHPKFSILFAGTMSETNIEPLLQFLKKMPHLDITVQDSLQTNLLEYDVLITAYQSTDSVYLEDILSLAASGRGWLNLIPLSEKTIPSDFGVQPLASDPDCELRVMFKNASHPMSRRLPEAIYFRSIHRPLQITADGVESLLYTDWHYQHSLVLSERQVGKGRLACTTLSAFSHTVLQQIFYRLLQRLAGLVDEPQDQRIGILGYAPSVGELHGQGALQTPGLSLGAFCDLNSDRLEQAKKDFKGIATYTSSKEMGNDPNIDLVVIATAPNSHAKLALDMITAGKHVVCEKPLCLSKAEADTIQQSALQAQVHLSCHQNRRFDVDYLAIKHAIDQGLIGDPFYLETFVGGFSHPCGYWHSHAPVSGGTAYDWGAHYIDWIVSLFPFKIDAVVGTRHKRVWADVSNADQERIQVRFSGGQEAEFIHSDIAALRKPKWYLLGTRGAIVGKWQDILTYDADPLLYYIPHEIPATEMPSQLTLNLRQENGEMVRQLPKLPERSHFAFHRNLADHILLGEPLAAPLSDSIKVVSVLEAASRSMDRGGTVEVIDA